MNVADLAAVGRVNLHMAGNNPVAQAGLEISAAFVLAEAFGYDVESFSGLQFGADAPGHPVGLGFALAQIADVGMNDHAVIGH